ncbi:MAG: hypothetical protein M3N23_04925, partial [Pseudomonadota bacterium]|nr:hypothetical protein [Pseudomonadota bacterium]
VLLLANVPLNFVGLKITVESSQSTLDAWLLPGLLRVLSFLPQLREFGTERPLHRKNQGDRVIDAG